MSLEAALYDILSRAAGVRALVGSSSPRIYPLTIPAGRALPAVVYQAIGSRVETTCDGDDAARTDLVQLTCWADNPDDARTLAEAVRTALHAGSGSHGGVTVTYCSIRDEGDAFDLGEDENLARYGKRQDWEIAYA